MKVFTVRIQLPEGRDDSLSAKIATDRLIARIDDGTDCGFGSKLFPTGTVVSIHDAATGKQLYQCGAFRHAPPDCESAAEEKGDAVREGDRRKR